MISLLKEKDAGLYLCSQKCEYGESTNKQIQMMLSCKMNDDVLTEFIKEMRNKIIEALDQQHRQELIDRVRSYIKIAAVKINDLSDIANNLMKCEHPADLLILLEILDERTTKKEKVLESIPSIVKDMLFNESSKDIIEKQLLVSDIVYNAFVLKNQIEKFVKLLLSTNDQTVADRIRSILYSPRVNELSANLIKEAATFVAPILGITPDMIIGELALKYLNNQETLLKLKEYFINNQNKGIKIKADVAQIYHDLYTGGTRNPATRKLVENPENILKKYDDDTLRAFINSLNSTYIHKYSAFRLENDLVSFLLLIDKPDLAIQLFEKSCYKPINKGKRNEELTKCQGDFIYEDFCIKLNNIIKSCLEMASFDALFKILSSKKVDSLSINYIYDILDKTTHRGSKNINKQYRYCTRELREKIIELIIEKIRNDSLLVYRSMREWYDRKEGFIYDKEKAVDLINYIKENLYKQLGDIIKEFNEMKRLSIGTNPVS